MLGFRRNGALSNELRIKEMEMELKDLIYERNNIEEWIVKANDKSNYYSNCGSNELYDRNAVKWGSVADYLESSLKGVERKILHTESKLSRLES